MLQTYFPVLLLLGFAIANAVMMLALSHLTLRPRPTPVKQTPYESGIPPLGDAHERFLVKQAGAISHNLPSLQNLLVELVSTEAFTTRTPLN